MAFKDRS
ncbi:39021859-4532-44d1-ae27-629239eee989 [Thermothielavioides terrestris]|nr:39021859-4532-44d1-ae27-629239eee989 [Thermothielavioides terrestris]